MHACLCRRVLLYVAHFQDHFVQPQGCVAHALCAAHSPHAPCGACAAQPTVWGGQRTATKTACRARTMYVRDAPLNPTLTLTRQADPPDGIATAPRGLHPPSALYTRLCTRPLHPPPHLPLHCTAPASAPVSALARHMCCAYFMRASSLPTPGQQGPAVSRAISPSRHLAAPPHPATSPHLPITYVRAVRTGGPPLHLGYTHYAYTYYRGAASASRLYLLWLYLLQGDRLCISASHLSPPLLVDVRPLT